METKKTLRHVSKTERKICSSTFFPPRGNVRVGGFYSSRLCNSQPLFSTHVNGGPRLSMLSVHVRRQMAGEGGRALGGREGGVAGLFPRRQGADPQRLGRAGGWREVRTHILQKRHTWPLNDESARLLGRGGGRRRASSPSPRRQTTAGASPVGSARAARPGGRSGAPGMSGRRRLQLLAGIEEAKTPLWMVARAQSGLTAFSIPLPQLGRSSRQPIALGRADRLPLHSSLFTEAAGRRTSRLRWLRRDSLLISVEAITIICKPPVCFSVSAAAARSHETTVSWNGRGRTRGKIQD